MENQNLNPFEDEKPQIVHFEKSESHYEFCRMQMHDIERSYRRTFLCNMVLCIFVCFLAIFQKYIGGFDLLSKPYAALDAPGAILAGGIFQIIIAMGIVLLGYLAWANFHTLNFILEAWYVIITVIGIARLDYLTALIGIIGAVFYFFAFREMRREQTLSEMEGYPDFQEKFDISKSDIVIQTLLAHQGEQRSKSTLFTTDYSLRKMKKKKPNSYGVPEFDDTDSQQEGGNAGAALAEELQKHIKEARDARQARTAIASLDAAAADIKRKQAAKQKQEAEEETVPEPEQTEASAAQEIPADADAPAETAVPENTAAEAPAAEADETAAKAEAILAEAEAKAQAILAEAAAKAEALKTGVTESAAEQAAKSETPAEKPAGRQSGTNADPNRKKKKKKR